MKGKKRVKKTKGKIIYGLTAEERFKEVHGMTMEEFHAKQEEVFKAKTGMTYDEWYINQITTKTPIEVLKEPKGTVTEDDIKLIKDLQILGLNDEVINVLLHYAIIVSRIGLVPPLVIEMGKSWYENNISTVEEAIVFVREAQKKHKESLGK
jgi:replication initiation and membrane attachment protein DnaB